MECIKIDNKEKCCGCTACYSICPVNAITMLEDEEGFLYPEVNKELCILCGKCKSVCPLIEKKNNDEPIKYFAAKNKNYNDRMSSSSGGTFSIIAEYVKENNGVIYGATFDENFNVKHERAEGKDEWLKFKGSKYVQSNLKNTFREVKKDLLEGKLVLFTGTPCHIDGLKSYLKNIDTNKLIICDIVCHGVPSPKIWSDYLKYIEKKYNTKIGDVKFRDKENVGWHDSAITIYDKNNEIILKEKQNENYYFLMFFNHLILRPSCYECKYSNFYRPGDFTLGDYWGIENHHADFDDNKGVSLVLINSNKGLKIWDGICDKLDYIEIKKEECVQPNLCAPSEKPQNRSFYWDSYRTLGFEFAGKRMGIIKSGKAFKIVFILDRINARIKRIFK